MRSTAALVAAFVSMFALGGCSGLGDGFTSPVFVDPAKYDLYDCERLKATRESLVKQADDKQRLIDKAKGGVIGSVVGEGTYRGDYIMLRAQIKSVDEYWKRNGCDAVTPPPTPAEAAAAKKR